MKQFTSRVLTNAINHFYTFARGYIRSTNGFVIFHRYLPVVFLWLMNNDITVFLPFTKRDEDQRMVYGYASTEAVDSQGEIVSKSAIEEALPDYMKFGNIREMHTYSAVGKTKEANIDQKGLFIGAKIVDDNAWAKVKEGVYNGFSIGGRKLSAIGNKITKLKLSEISVVDRPANPDAVFSVVKADGLKKYEDMMVAEQEGKKPNPKEEKERQEMVDMFDASYILNMAKELAWLAATYKAMKKPTKNLDAAIKNLKQCAKDNLGKSDFIVVDELLKGAITETEEKQERFAYTDARGNQYLAMFDKAHTLNSIGKFAQTTFDSPEVAKSVAEKLIKAAQIFGIALSPNSVLAKTASGDTSSVLVWNQNWEVGYYQQMRKVLG